MFVHVYGANEEKDEKESRTYLCREAWHHATDEASYERITRPSGINNFSYGPSGASVARLDNRGTNIAITSRWEWEE